MALILARLFKRKES